MEYADVIPAELLVLYLSVGFLNIARNSTVNFVPDINSHLQQQDSSQV